MDCEKLISSLYNGFDEIKNKIIVNKEWFEVLWEQNADEYRWFELAQTIKPTMTFTEFDKGWQHRNVNCEKIEQSLVEFTNLLFGWY